MRPAVLPALLALCLATALPLRSSFAEAGPAATPADAGPTEIADAGTAATAPAASLQIQGETASAGGLPSPEEGEITRIAVQGNRRVETDAVKNALPVKPGDTYNKARVKATLLAVWRMGYFNDVRIDVSPLPVPQIGTVFTVIVVEKPAVHQVKFEGNEEIATDDLTKDNNIEVRQYQILDQEAVRRSVKKVQDKYIEKGFFLAEVSSRIDQKPNNEVDVVFVVSEHAKVMVKEVRFVGNKSITAAELKGQMVTTEGNLFSFFTSSGTYREDAFQRDDYILQSMYYDRGFINVKFGKPAIELSPDKRFIFITFLIDEGEAYNVGKIDVGGDLLESKEFLMTKIVLKPGDRFNRSQIGKDITALADVYKDKGYAYANVAPATGMDVAKKTVDLTYEMQKGNLVTIERIEVVGNSKTRDKVVRRELRIEEGQLYNATQVKISKQRVSALGFFDGVEINQRRGSSDDKMVLEVSIKEKLTGTFQVGFGFTGGESFFGTAQVSQNNLLGYGTTGSLSLQLSSIRQLVQISYLDPYLFDTFWTGSVDLYRSQLIYTGFQRNTIGGALTTGYDLTNFAHKGDWTHWLEDFHIFLTYTLEHLDVLATGTSSQLLANQFVSGLTSSVRLSFNYDRRDNRLFPTEGHLESGSAEFASSLLGSENLFQRYRMIERRYFPLGNGMVFKFNINLGYIRSTDPIDHPLAISEKFFEGGINSLRGYNLYSISPYKAIASQLSPTAGIVDFAIGGNKELITNWEFEFPLVEAAGVRGVAFYDAGNVYGENENLFQHNTSAGGALPLGLFHSVGAGVRWFSPLGPLRFELGFPLTRRAQDEAYQFEFTIGNFF
jgi:outer membrane protein insertion porin family